MDVDEEVKDKAVDDPCVEDPLFKEGLRRMDLHLNAQSIREVMGFHT